MLPPLHPGRTLASELEARADGECARAQAARAAFWINLQAQYDLAVAQQEFGMQIAREVETAA